MRCVASQPQARLQASMSRTRRRLLCTGRMSNAHETERSHGPQTNEWEAAPKHPSHSSGNQPAYAGSSKILVAEAAAKRIVPTVEAPKAIARAQIAAAGVGRLLVIGVVVRRPVIIGSRGRHAAWCHTRRNWRRSHWRGTRLNARCDSDDSRTAPAAQRNGLRRRNENGGLAAIADTAIGIRIGNGHQAEAYRQSRGLEFHSELGAAVPRLRKAGPLAASRVVSPSIGKVNDIAFARRKALRHS